jgi:hypothetical protein
MDSGGLIISNYFEDNSEYNKEIKEFHNRFSNSKKISKKDKSEFAKFLKLLTDETFNDYKPIEETCGVMAGFFQYDFEDDLDEIFDLAAELELPKEYVSGDVFKKWELLKNKLTKYLDGKHS